MLLAMNTMESLNPNLEEQASIEALGKLTDETLADYAANKIDLSNEKSLYETAILLRNDLPNFSAKYPNRELYNLFSRFLRSYYQRLNIEGVREIDRYESNYFGEKTNNLTEKPKANQMRSFEGISRAYGKINGTIPMDFDDNKSDYEQVVNIWKQYWDEKGIDPQLAFKIAETLYRQDAYGSNDLIVEGTQMRQDFLDRVEAQITAAK